MDSMAQGRQGREVTITTFIPDWMVAYYASIHGYDADHESVAQSFVDNMIENAYDSARDDGWDVPEEG